MKIRSANHTDWLTLVDFQLAMAQETENISLDPVILGAGMKAVLTQPEKGQYFVAEIEDQLAGSLMITYEWSDWRNGWIWWIQSVYVKPEHRGKGVYKALYQHIQTLVNKDPNIRGIRLYVDKTNHEAQKVYTKLGMNGDHYTTYEWMK